MTQLKKLIFGFLMTALLLCCLAILPHPQAEAATVASGTCGDNATWALDDTGTLTISGTGAMTNYTSVSSVPWYSSRSSIKNVIIKAGVTSIGDYAFYICSGLSDITIPNSVTSIGNSAFYNCNGLTSFSIPNSVTSIGDNAFKMCTNLTSIVIPNSVTSIGKHAFSCCKSLTSITIPSSVNTIGSSAFYQCSGLTSITIKNGVTSIGDNAFDLCDSLTTITIPDSVTSIGFAVFEGCTSLESITVPFVGSSRKTASDTYQSPLGYFFGKNQSYGVKTTQYYYGSSTSTRTYSIYYIPSSLKSVTVTGGNILYGAFYGCEGLTSITIGDNVTSIGELAFCSCKGLTNITIPSSITSIGKQAFFTCPNLKEIFFSGSAPEIDTIAFRNVTATAYYYPDETWTEDVMQDYGGTITWVPRGVALSYKAHGEVENPITIELFTEGSQKAAHSFTNQAALSNTGTWTVKGVTPDTYLVKAAKKNHVAREYTLTVGNAAAALDVELWLIGDVTGDGLVNFSDYSKVLSQSKNPNSQTLTDYAFLCGDVTGDGIINFSDYSKILSQAKGNHTLW